MIAALAVEAVNTIATYIVDALTPFFAFSAIKIEEETILPNRSAQIVEIVETAPTAETAETAKVDHEIEIVQSDTEAKTMAKIVKLFHGFEYLDHLQLHLTADCIITAILPIGTTKIIAIATTDTVEILAITKNECIALLDIVEPIKIDFMNAYTNALARVPKALKKLRDSQRRRAQACTGACTCTSTCTTCTCTCTTCTNSSSATEAGTAICPRKVKVQRILDDFNGVQTKRMRTRMRTRKSKSQRKRESKSKSKSKSKSDRSAVRCATATATDQEQHSSATTTCSTRLTHGRRCA